MRFLKGLLIVFGALYLVIACLLYAYQEAVIFHPRARAADHIYSDYPEEWIEVEEGVRLNALMIPDKPAERAEGVILYLHGNKGDNGRSLHQVKSLMGMGYDLYLVDYRGFGKSEGIIGGEENMTDDLQIVYNELKQHYQEENILLVGYSLGTGPASFLAAENEPRGVVLVAPYTSLIDMKNEFLWMFPDFLLTYELSNLRHLRESRAPVKILHGTNDKLIPIAMGEQLKEVDTDRIELLPLEGVSHRGAIFSDQFSKAVEELIGGN